MLLETARSQLLVVDMQAKLMPAILDGETILRNAGILVRAAGQLGLPITVTEQYPQGLGATLMPLREALASDTAVLSKLTFSAALEPAIADRIVRLMAQGRDQIVLCGVEAHICVLQSALGFKERGAHVFVVGDAVSSRSAHSMEAARFRLLQEDCRWITTEMAMFEWLERAGTDMFKTLSGLIR